MSPTPTPQDEELRNKVKHLIFSWTGGTSPLGAAQQYEALDKSTDEMVQLIKAYGDQRELESDKRAQKKIHALNRIMERSILNADGCREWQGPLNHRSYGMLTYDDGRFKSKYAHRVAYYVIKGIDPGELTIDHLCNNTICLNVDHMQVVTRKYNTTRRRRPTDMIDHCDAGHKLEGDNLRMRWTNSDGKRIQVRGCVTCKKISAAKYRAKKRLLLTTKKEKE